MKIKRAEAYGMCFGVRDALQVAEALAEDKRITVLGELAHNPIVRERLRKHGVEEGKLDQFDGIKTKDVVITAHGTSDRLRKTWRENGFQVWDTTCPLVHRAHRELEKLVNKGYFPVVIGKASHVEVKGLCGDFEPVYVMENEKDIRRLPMASQYGVVAQTTQPIDKVLHLVAVIQKRYPQAEVLFRDTVCQPTKDRQNALKKLCREVELLVVVGGNNSNNTRQLVLRAKEEGKARGLSVYQVENADQILPEWFFRVHSVGITAGTSTLISTVNEVEERIHALTTGEKQ